jgi:hypothetical protein
MPIMGKMTKEQRAAVKQLKDAIDQVPERYSDFYKHLKAEGDARMKSC